ncbi:MAG: hypothetical protein ABEI86_02175 [Halobacteriaceae archaeon]
MGLASWLTNTYVMVALVSVALVFSLPALVFFLTWIETENHIHGLIGLIFLSPWWIVVNKNSYLPSVEPYLGIPGTLGLLLYFGFFIALFTGMIGMIMEGEFEGIFVVIPVSILTYYVFGFIPHMQRLLLTTFPVLIGLVVLLLVMMLASVDGGASGSASTTASSARTITESNARKGLEKVESKLKRE